MADLRRVRIGLWGAPGSGKTTFLSAVHLAANSGGWTISPRDPLSQRIMRDAFEGLVLHRRFPAATAQPDSFAFSFSGEVERRRLVGRRRERLNFDLELIDVPGEFFGGSPDRDSLFDDRCEGLVYLHDPTRDLRESHLGNLSYFKDALLGMAGRSRLDRSGLLPQHLAVCVTKLDDPEVFGVAVESGWITQEDSLSRIPRVAAGREEEFFAWWCDRFPDGPSRLILDYIENYFKRSRVAFFVVSSIGFKANEDSAVDIDDCSNLNIRNGRLEIVQTPHPVNVLEPLVWLARSIRSVDDRSIGGAIRPAGRTLPDAAQGAGHRILDDDAATEAGGSGVAIRRAMEPFDQDSTGGRRMRERLLAQVLARLERFGVGRDPATVLAAEATAELATLLETVPDPAADLEVAHAAGWLHWFRYLVLDPGEDQRDLAAAVALFEPVYRARPAAVPDQVRTYFDERRLTSSDADNPRALAGRAAALLAEALRTGDRSALNTAIDLLGQAVAATPAGHRYHASRLSNLALALQTRFERTGSMADLDAAVATRRQAEAAVPADHPDRAAALSDLGVALGIRYERTGELEDLEAAVTAARQAVAAAPAGHPDYVNWLSNLGAAVQTRFGRSAETADLDEAVEASRRAVAAAPADHPHRASMLSNLSAVLRTRFEWTGEPADLDAAVAAGREAVQITPADRPERTRYLSNLAAALGTRFARAGALADLDAAVTAGREAVDATATGRSDRAAMLSNLCHLLETRYERAGEPADLDAAVTAAREAVDTTPTGHPDRAAMLSAFGGALRRRFERTGESADLDAAVAAAREAVAITPAGHPDRVKWLSNLGSALHSRYERFGAPADLDAAAAAGRDAVALAPAGHPDRAMLLSNFGGALRSRYERTGSAADLDEAVAACRQALDATPTDHPDRARRQSNLGLALHTQFERTGDAAALDEAVAACRLALDATPAGHPDRAGRLSSLGRALCSQFERTGIAADLNEAVAASREAVAAAPAGHPDRAAMLSNLSTALRARFGRTDSATDLEEAVTAAREAVAAALADHPGRAGWLSGLGNALVIRFGRTGSASDLDAAVAAAREAVAVAPAGHPARAGWLSNLSTALTTRFGRAGELADLDGAVDAGREAVAAAPAGRPARAEMLSTLGVALRARFERTGNMPDLDEAVAVGRQAVAATPAGHPGRAGRLSNLGVALNTRFRRSGELADLDDAVTASREAVNDTLAGHPGRAAMLSNLGGVLQTRFERTGDPADLDAAVDAGRQAVAATPADHPDRAKWLNNLGTALQARFMRTGSAGDLDDAVAACRQAVDAGPAGHPDRALYLSNLGMALHTRFERSGEQADVDAAVAACRQAVVGTSAGHPDRAKRLHNLGTALNSRFGRTGEPADVDAAVAVGRQAVEVVVASPRVRVRAAAGWGRAAAVGGRWPLAAEGFEAAAELVGQVAPRRLARGDQEHQLEQLGGLGADAAACCVRAGEAGRAVELFEQCRGVLLGQALDARTDLTALGERHPDLAGRFTALCEELDRADDHSGLPVAIPAGTGGALTPIAGHAHREDGDISRRREAADEFERLIGEIQRLPDFGHFLHPPPLADLVATAARGPVVVVAVSRFGSYALILTGGGMLEPVPLGRLTPDAVYERVIALHGVIDDMSAADGERAAAAERRLTDMLGWLWDVLAGPVLDRLGFTGPPRKGEPWPRLWWCTSGLLSFLPVHAAGHHDTRRDSAPATVSDRVVSSYTPTVRALAHARRGLPTGSGDGGGRVVDLGAGRMVAVAMPHTPGASDLPGAEDEVAALQARLDDRVTVLTGPEATREAVVRELPGARWAHFACHGYCELINPSASRLLLADHEERPLTVVDVARLRLDGAELAFLSACETARPGGRLADEAIHLASAFQLAGYRHVVGTLWPVADTPASMVVEGVYTGLAGAGTGDVAGAVHAATRRLRDWWADTPSAWAAHIHVGA